jgi:hypothetical protein
MLVERLTHRRVFSRAPRERLFVLTMLISTVFWDKKLKIAILTLATFAALC